MSTLFVIVGKNDKPLYSFEYSDAKVRWSTKQENNYLTPDNTFHYFFV